jgi:hypothetical protein
MLVVDGYKMTHGEATICINGREIHTDGVFLYRPDDEMWHMAPNRDFPWGATFRKEEMQEIREAGRT